MLEKRNNNNLSNNNLNFIDKLIKKSVQFESFDNFSKFTSIFTRLYNLEILKDSLDLCLTQIKKNRLFFMIKIMKDWDTNQGCYLVESNKISNKLIGIFNKDIYHKIIIKACKINVIAHEMAHALEVESRINLLSSFKENILKDMSNMKNISNLSLKKDCYRLLIEEVKPYPKNHIISELFARYFELLSISKNCYENADFKLEEITSNFPNTSNWMVQIFNPFIKKQIDQDISDYSSKYLLNKISNKKKFTDNIDPFHNAKGKYYSSTSGKNISYSGNVKSNQSYYDAFKRYENKNNN